MSQRQIVQIICDMPHDDAVEGALPVSITTNDGTWVLDMCADHAAHFLLPVIAAASKQPRRGRPRTGGKLLDLAART